jgi:hypothetical protein
LIIPATSVGVEESWDIPSHPPACFEPTVFLRASPNDRVVGALEQEPDGDDADVVRRVDRGPAKGRAMDRLVRNAHHSGGGRAAEVNVEERDLKWSPMGWRGNLKAI